MELSSALLFTFVIGLFIARISDCTKWCKWLILYMYVRIYKRNTKKRIDLYDYTVKNDPVKVNFVIPEEEHELESPQPESHLRNRDDEILFYGGNSKSEILVAKINRKCNNKAEAFIFLKLETGKIYKLEKTFDFQQACVDEVTFSCGGLQLQCESPMRRWRLFFAGYLRETSDENISDQRMIYVKFALLWKAASDVYDFKYDISLQTFVRGLTEVPLKTLHSQYNNLQEALDFYGQAGTIHGEVTVENEFENREIYLFGQRIRYLGNPTQLKPNEFHHILGYTKKSGKYLHLSQIKALSNRFSFGFLVESNCDLYDADHTSVSVFESKERGIGSASANFNIGVVPFNFEGCTFGFEFLKESGPGNDFKRIEFNLNGETGYGILFKRPHATLRSAEVSEIKKIKVPSVLPDVVTFKEEICQLADVSGGKGSSLGKLSHLSEELKTYSVPDGVAVTTKAYASFLTQDILKEIECLEKHSYKKDRNLEEITAACNRVSETIKTTDFSAQLRGSIVEKLNGYFGNKLNSLKFAIRSSATGEDTEQMSAAGQMETFLGVSGIDEILLAVKKCWASQFSFIATEYKRRYGQCFNSPMAVVIQEMVPCDVAGVLFTCDPLTGNPTLMSITANYGLGESVVSGTEEPDLIQLKRDEHDKLQIKSVTLGEKNRKIVMADSGTNIKEVNENQRKVCCISEELILHLGYTAIKIESHYRSHRDVEWGILNDKLYIFQSRPVTSSTKESIHEIEHEFDSPMRVENDFFSVSNLAEVMPKALSPLGLDASFKSFYIATKAKKDETVFSVKGKNQYFPKVWFFFYNHFVFNFAELFPMRPDEKLDVTKKATIISMFGRIPDNEEMFEVAKARSDSQPKKSSLFMMYTMLKALIFCGKTLEKTKKSSYGYRIPVEKYRNSYDLFRALCRACTDLTDVSICHVICSQTSSLLNMIVFSSLGAARGKFDDIVYKDFAKLLKTNSEVESADIPSATQRIAYLIAQEIDPEEFKNMSKKEALKWLQTSQGKAGQEFRNFMERHGHRSVQEFDLYSIPWRETPEQLVNSLQALTGFVSKESLEKKSQTFNDALSEITIRPGFFSKMILKYILPFTRKGVQNREMSKSMVVKGMDEWRKGWRHLSQLMVLEGRIPEEDLLFFMTVDEIKHLLRTRSPKIIAKATQRMKRYPVMNDYRFPEIMKGFPKPMDLTVAENISSVEDFSMQGIPVSQGIAKGYVRKAITIEDAADIKPGEILVTLGTDIAWSPYFPHLAGVVTELGGLISHGAVVSREYGIPCIAGLHGATKYFQTGDYVLLDGNRGILQKMEPKKNSELEKEFI